MCDESALGFTVATVTESQETSLTSFLPNKISVSQLEVAAFCRDMAPAAKREEKSCIRKNVQSGGAEKVMPGLSSVRESGRAEQDRIQAGENEQGHEGVSSVVHFSDAGSRFTIQNPGPYLFGQTSPPLLDVAW